MMKTLNKTPRVKQVMTAFPYSLEKHSTVGEAREMMKTHNIRHLPVTSGGKISGILSDRDLPENVPNKQEIAFICTPHPYVVDLDTPLADVSLEMAERHISSAIVTYHERLAGIITSVDLCRFLGNHLNKLFSEEPQALA